MTLIFDYLPRAIPWIEHVALSSYIRLKMGCTNSRRIGNTLILHPQFKSIENIVIPLTDEQIKILRETWEIIEPTKKEIGVNVYIRYGIHLYRRYF